VAVAIALDKRMAVGTISDRREPMEILITNARGTAAAPHWSEQLAAASAAALVAGGARVRWLWPHAGGRQRPELAGVELLAVAGAVPPFRRVQAQIEDAAADLLLTQTLRTRPADLVHHMGFGGPGSVNSLWIADRMGSHASAAVRAAEVLCHRQTLIDERGRACRAFEDAARCRDCCTTAGTGSLTDGQAWLARWLRPLGALSPFPSRNQFRNRLELAVGNLQLAVAVYVASAADAELLATAGIGRRSLQVVPLDQTLAAALRASAGVAT